MKSNLLSKLFEKKGIKDVTELTGEEKVVFENYERILSKEKVEIPDVEKFLELQIDAIESRWKDYSIEHSKKSELIPYHTCYKSLLQVLKSPLVEKENLEKYLLNLINQ